MPCRNASIADAYIQAHEAPEHAQSAIRRRLLQRVVRIFSPSPRVPGTSHALAFLGTILGPHVVRAGERPARLCTSCTATSWLELVRDLRKRVIAIYWGSSGRRFKSCQPDRGKSQLRTYLLVCWNPPIKYQPRVCTTRYTTTIQRTQVHTSEPRRAITSDMDGMEFSAEPACGWA